MNKNILIVVGMIIVISSISGYLFFKNKPALDNQEVNNTIIFKQPDRVAEINGYITSIQGNEVMIDNEIGAKEVTDEERARRQKLTQEERQALKAQESANLTKETVNIIIPVGVTIVKGSGTADGTNVKAEISELTKGIYVSIWKTDSVIEYVKLKGVSNQ